MTTSLVAQIHAYISHIAPIEGVSGSLGNWQIQFASEATPEEKTAAQDAANSYVPPPEPSWNGFRDAIALNETWERVLNQSPAIAATIVSLWSRMDDDAIAQVIPLWNRLAERYHSASPFTDEEIDGLNAIAATNNIPVTLDEAGQMAIALLTNQHTIATINNSLVNSTRGELLKNTQSK